MCATPLPFLIGAASSALLSLLFLTLVVVRKGAWLPLRLYAALGICFSLFGWLTFLRGRETLMVEQVQGCTMAVAAWAVLTRINEEMSPGTSRMIGGLGLGVTLLAAGFLIHIPNVLVTVLSHAIFIFALVVAFRLYVNPDHAEVPLSDVMHFWVVVAFLVQFPAQVATSNWVYITTNKGYYALIWLFFFVNALPVALSSFFLYRATRASK